MNHRAPNRGAAALLGAAIVAVAVAAFAQTPSLISPEAQKRIIEAPGVSVLGATSPDVVVVEYFDFNCPFCRKLAPSFRSLLKSDPKVAVVQGLADLRRSIGIRGTLRYGSSVAGSVRKSARCFDFGTASFSE
jgi:hypothetical protein